jgi:hypothetical protein
MKSGNSIKKVAKNGQICLGKDFAGQTVQVTKNPDHSITIIPVVVIPSNEQWLLKDNGIQRLNKSIEWAESHKRNTKNTQVILNQLEHKITK